MSSDDPDTTERTLFWQSAMNAIYPDRIKRWISLGHLAHYTSLSSFKRIVQNGTVLLSSIADMNDRDEVTEAVFQVIELLNSERPALLLREIHQLYPDITRYLEHYLNRAYTDGEIYNHVYCLCMSEHDCKKDRDGKLSMWRAYGGDGNGVAIVFPGKADDDDSDDETPPPFELVPVDYVSPPRFRVKARRALVRPLAELLVRKPALDSVQQHDIAYLLLKVVLMLAVTFKHQGFKDEKEWRLVYIKEPASQLAPAIGKLTAIEVGRKLRPVYQVPLEAILSGRPAPDLLTEIIVGPSDDQKMHMTALTNLLCYDLAWPIEITKRVRASSIPYRSRN